MLGLLLDTHTLFWLVTGEAPLADAAVLAIARAQAAGQLYVSPISAWELSVAALKRPSAGRPDLGSDPAHRWFRSAMRATTARIIPIRQTVALAAAQVVTDTGHKDPGDCYLIGAARTRRIPIATRDAAIRGIAETRPDYLSVVPC